MPIAMPGPVGAPPVGSQITAFYQYELNGLLFGSQTDFMVLKIEGLLGKSDIKTTDLDRQDAWGEFPGRNMYKGRKIVFTIAVLSGQEPNAQISLDALQAAWSIPDLSPPPPPSQLVFYHPWKISGERFYWVYPGRMAVPSDSDGALGLFNVVAELKANDPRSYSMLETVDTFTIATGATTANTQSVNNGDSASPPILNIQGPCTNPQVVNFTDNARAFKMNITLAGSDTLQADFRQRTITKNGIDVSNYMALDSQWWKIQPGSNLIVYARTDSGASSTIAVHHRDCWS